MKKTYQSPVTVTIAIKSNAILTTGSFHLNAEGGTATPYQEDAVGDALSRRGDSLWDDED